MLLLVCTNILQFILILLLFKIEAYSKQPNNIQSRNLSQLVTKSSNEFGALKLLKDLIVKKKCNLDTLNQNETTRAINPINATKAVLEELLANNISNSMVSAQTTKPTTNNNDFKFQKYIKRRINRNTNQEQTIEPYSLYPPKHIKYNTTVKATITNQNLASNAARMTDNVPTSEIVSKSTSVPNTQLAIKSLLSFKKPTNYSATFRRHLMKRTPSESKPASLLNQESTTAKDIHYRKVRNTVNGFKKSPDRCPLIQCVTFTFTTKKKTTKPHIVSKSSSILWYVKSSLNVRKHEKPLPWTVPTDFYWIGKPNVSLRFSLSTQPARITVSTSPMTEAKEIETIPTRNGIRQRTKGILIRGHHPLPESRYRLGRPVRQKNVILRPRFSNNFQRQKFKRTRRWLLSSI